MQGQRITLQADDPVDLHMHTTFSDGHWAPQQLIDHLAEHRFKVAAITDHDRIDSLPGLLAMARERGLMLIPATEVTAEWEGKLAHILCLGVDPQSREFAALLQDTVDRQLRNTQEVYDRLRQQGYSYPRRDEILPGGELRRPSDNITLLMEHGYVTNRAEGLARIKEAGFLTMKANLAAVVEIGHQAGAVVLFAHPGRRDDEFVVYDPTLLERVRSTIPFDGLEATYPLHSASQTDDYYRYAAKHELLTSCGSDSHGPRHRLPIAYKAGLMTDLLHRFGVLVE